MADRQDRSRIMSEEEICADFTRREAEERQMDRREFLMRAVRGAAATALSVSALHSLISSPLMAQGTDAPPAGVRQTKPKVVLVKHTKIQGEGHTLSQQALDAMLEAGLCALTGKATVADAWQSLIKPTDRVAVKYQRALSDGRITTLPTSPHWIKQHCKR